MAAEKKTTKKTKAVKETKKEEKTAISFEGKSVSELKVDLQKLLLDIRTGKEKNTSLVKKLKVAVARIKTTENQSK